MIPFLISLAWLLGILVGAAILWSIIKWMLKKTKMSYYGIEMLYNPSISFLFLFGYIIFRKHLMAGLSGVFLIITAAIWGFIICSSLLLIILSCIADIKDPHGMTKSDYFLRLVVNLIFLIMDYGLIYWFLFTILPSSFYIMEGAIWVDGTFRQLWQFFYYSFTVAITYGDGTIMSVGMLAQAVQITEVIIFYFIIARNVETYLRKTNRFEEGSE